MNEVTALDAEFQVVLRMNSDWHVGAGVGRPGDVDSLVRRDSAGLPFVPAKTLTGIWRDACEAVALGLDGGDEAGVWTQWVNYIFGSQPSVAGPEPSEEQRASISAPRSALLSVRAARLPEDLREAVSAKRFLHDAVTFVKPGISIHPRTGRTRVDFLRFEEMARCGAGLTAECELRLPDKLHENSEHDEEARLAATALLVAGACFVERIGGSRRRGSGRCDLFVKGADAHSWLSWIEKHQKPVEPPKYQNASPTDDAPSGRATGEWVRVQLRITTASPVIVLERTVGNLVKTLEFIPGTYLLPLVTAKLSGIGVDARSAIAHGDLLITNATPETTPSLRFVTRPTPLNLYYRKLDGGLIKGKGVLNRFEESAKGPQLKPQRGGYVGPSDGKMLPAYVKTQTAVETHNVVEDKSQRPTGAVGGVFTYESIVPDTSLRAELRLRNSLVEALSAKNPGWRQALEDESYRIGRARKDDYGVVRIELAENDEPEDENNIEERPIPNTLTALLLSNLLLRDERLRPTADINHFTRELERRLGVNLGLRGTPRSNAMQSNDSDCSNDSPKLMNFAARQHRTDSWQTSWGLPRPSLAGLSAGSCFVFEVAGGEPTDFWRNLRRVTEEGLGERRAEGYGQICFNDPLLSATLGSTETARNNATIRTQDPRISPNSQAHAYGRLIETAAWRKEIRRRALDHASKRDRRKQILGIELDGDKSKPRMSQLGALRSVLNQLHQCEDAVKVTNWNARLRNSENRKREWPQGHKDQKGSLELVDELVSDKKRVWELIKDDEVSWAQFTITQDGEMALVNDLWAEAVRILVDACVRAHKRDLEEVQKKVKRSSSR